MSLLRTTALTLAVATLLAAGSPARAQLTDWHAPMLAPGTSHTSHADRPSWVDETLEPTNRAQIVRMVEGKADVVLLDGGLYQGFRAGVVCTVQHPTGSAQLIIVASEENRSAALIMSNDLILVPGDVVRISTL